MSFKRRSKFFTPRDTSTDQFAESSYSISKTCSKAPQKEANSSYHTSKYELSDYSHSESEGLRKLADGWDNRRAKYMKYIPCSSYDILVGDGNKHSAATGRGANARNNGNRANARNGGNAGSRVNGGSRGAEYRSQSRDNDRDLQRVSSKGVTGHGGVGAGRNGNADSALGSRRPGSSRAAWVRDNKDSSRAGFGSDNSGMNNQLKRSISRGAKQWELKGRNNNKLANSSMSYRTTIKSEFPSRFEEDSQSEPEEFKPTANHKSTKSHNYVVGYNEDERVESQMNSYNNIESQQTTNFQNTFSRCGENESTKDEIIEKYETVLKELNSEFKHLLGRTNQLESQLTEEKRNRESNEALIESLHKNQINSPDRQTHKTEIAKLAYQLTQYQDSEKKLKSNITHLTSKLETFESLQKTSHEREVYLQSEINQLLEKYRKLE